VTSSTGNAVLPSGGAAVDLDLLRVDLTGVNLFVGVGGKFDTSTPGDFSVDITDATGFSAANANLSVAFARVTDAAATDTRQWTGIAASADDLSVVGLEDITMNVNDLEVMFNLVSKDEDPTANTNYLDWSKIYTDENDRLNGLNGNTTSVLGNAVVDIDGFVQVSGGFAFTRSAGQQVFLDDETVSEEMTVTTFGFDKVNAFVGAGPYFVDSNGNGVIDDDDTPSDEAAAGRVTSAVAAIESKSTGAMPQPMVRW
jgi:hypothetical protein